MCGQNLAYFFHVNALCFSFLADGSSKSVDQINSNYVVVPLLFAEQQDSTDDLDSAPTALFTSAEQTPLQIAQRAFEIATERVDIARRQATQDSNVANIPQ